jgi:hypothetical protein
MNRRDARRPDFIVVGAARSATTWIHQALSPYVGLPRRTKETDFFSTNYSLGLDWYLAHFRGYPKDLVLGEISPTYFDSDEAPGRVAHVIPRCKIICSLRDPVQRLYSHYRLLKSEGWITRQTFAQALEQHEKWAGRAGNMIGTNRYAFHVQRWFEALGKSNVLVTFYDDLEADPQGYIDQLTSFVAIPLIDLNRSPIGSRRVNLIERAPRHPHLAARARRLRGSLERRRMYRTIEMLRPFFHYCAGRGEEFPPLASDSERLLRARFRPEVEALERLVGRDLSQWKNRGVR